MSEGLEKLADDVAKQIWTDVIGKRAEWDGWYEDRRKAAELIRRALLAAGTEGLPRYPVELRCAELEEKMKALNGYLRHHDTCLKAMTWKNTGFDDTAPCDCGLDAALRGESKPKEVER